MITGAALVIAIDNLLERENRSIRTELTEAESEAVQRIGESPLSETIAKLNLVDQELRTAQSKIDQQKNVSREVAASGSGSVDLEVMRKKLSFDLEKQLQQISQILESLESYKQHKLIRAARAWKSEMLDQDEILQLRALSKEMAQLSDKEIMLGAGLLRERLKELTGPTAQKRNQVAFVSTIIRPLSTKWFSRWLAEGRKDINLPRATQEAKQILATEYSKENQLPEFFRKVYSLFEDVVVYRGNDRKPGGTVSESSRRAYAAAWMNFEEQKSREVWLHAQKISRNEQVALMNEVFSSGRGASPRARASNLNTQIFANESKLSLYATSAGPDLDQDQPSSANRPLLTIRVSLSYEPAGLTAYREWSDTKTLEREFKKWLDGLIDLWDVETNNVTAKVESLNDGQILASIAIPPSSSDLLIKRIAKAANF